MIAPTKPLRVGHLFYVRQAAKKRSAFATRRRDRRYNVWFEVLPDGRVKFCGGVVPTAQTLAVTQQAVDRLFCSERSA